MQKTRYFPRLKDNNKQLARYGVPYNTALDWSKKQNDESNYRGLLYDRLSLYIVMEENAKKKIKQLFTENELKALSSLMKSTMYTHDLVQSRDFLAYMFQDYCTYEAMEVREFADDLEVFSKQVSEKLLSLVEFERYVLLEFLRSEDGRIEV